MPKEKTTRKAATKGADKSAGGKKKKGTSNFELEYASSAPANASPDPNMPKRGLSAYMFFANDQREKVREENPGIKFGKF